jgi:hypothetical protein
MGVIFAEYFGSPSTQFTDCSALIIIIIIIVIVAVIVIIVIIIIYHLGLVQ